MAMVGDVFITNVEPVPVCAATAVALPVEVIGPVRLALVVTVEALPEIEPAIVFVNVCVPAHVLEVVVPKARENTPAVSTTGYVADTASCARALVK